MIRLARPFDNFGEGVDVSLQNRIECWVADGDNLANNAATDTLWDTAMWDVDVWDSVLKSFVKLYSGYISAYAPVIDDQKQFVDVTVLGYVTEASYHIHQDTSGNTTISYVNKDPSYIMKDIIDQYRANGGINLNYSGTSVQSVGISVNYTFNHNTMKECFDAVLQLCPQGWFYYIDATNTLYFKQQSTRADHTPAIGKDIGYMQAQKRVENIANVVYVVGGGNPNLFNKYIRAGSVSTYGKFERKIQDGRVTDNTTSDYIAKSTLDTNQLPETRTILRIADDNGENTYAGEDIERYQVGDTIQIKNLNYGATGLTLLDVAKWDIDVWDAPLQFTTASVLIITSVQYEPDYIEIEASSRLPEISRRIEEVNKLANTTFQVNLPTVPTVRSV